jgi:hypothetical protein
VLGESPITSMVRWMMSRYVAYGHVPPIHVAEAHGCGGTPLSRLSKGRPPYENGLMLWNKAARFVKERGAAGIWAPTLHMDHGEADRPETSRGRYTRHGCGFRQAAEEDLRAITGQSEPVWWVMSQLASAAGAQTEIDGAWTALSQFDLMKAAPRTTIAMPGYFFQGRYGLRDVHFSPLGHALRGEYQGKASLVVQRAIWNAIAGGRNPWDLTLADVRTCLRPDLGGITRDGSVIRIPIILPEDGSEVVLDTETLPPAINLGFLRIGGSGGSIETVHLEGNTIVIRLSEPGSIHLRYAYDNSDSSTQFRSAAWGNFRDNCNEDSIAVPGLKLSNWLVTFDADIP